MKNLFLLILAVGCMTLFACKSDGTGGASQQARSKTASGYEYIHHIKNDGPKAQEGDKAFFHIIVQKNDTMKLQSSYDRGVPFPQIIPSADNVPKPIPPTYEALLMMAKGDSLTIWQNLDSMPNLPPNFLPTDRIRFDMKLVDIQTKAEVEAAVAAAKVKQDAVFASTKNLIKDYNAGKLNAQLKTTASGLKYIVHKEGTGNQATVGKSVKVHYAGFLTDETPFDDSFKRGEPIDFPLGQGAVIKGWDEGIGLFKAGTEATLFIPSDLGYGDAGSPPKIPGKSELVFFVELVEAAN